MRKICQASELDFFLVQKQSSASEFCNFYAFSITYHKFNFDLNCRWLISEPCVYGIFFLEKIEKKNQGQFPDILVM